MEESGMETKGSKIKSSRPEASKLRRTCMLFTVLNILLLALFGLTVTYLLKDLNTEITQSVELCVDCSYLRSHPDDGLPGVTQKTEKKCCVENEENLYDLVHLFAGNWIKRELSDTNPKYSKYKCGDEDDIATIKLVGRTEKQEFSHHRKLLWDGVSDLAIIPTDKHLTHHQEHGFIEVKKPGLFFVYSQLVLEHDGPGSVKDFTHGPVTYQHSVYLIKSGNSQEDATSILSNRDTRCSCTRDKYRFTSHIGSTFQLYEGDRLFVKVNNVTEVVPDPHMNHFGAHRL